jgi:hypothetical protein
MEVTSMPKPPQRRTIKLPIAKQEKDSKHTAPTESMKQKMQAQHRTRDIKGLADPPRVDACIWQEEQ